VGELFIKTDGLEDSTRSIRYILSQQSKFLPISRVGTMQSTCNTLIREGIEAGTDIAWATTAPGAATTGAAGAGGEPAQLLAGDTLFLD
jgi:hypothetical protein